MGKTIKGKEKTAAKIAKAKRKIARKAKRGVALVAFAVALSCLFSGCATSEAMQPAKSMTQNNSFEDCNIIVAGRVKLPIGGGTNAVIVANGGELPTTELFTQTQSLESTGSTESFAPTATQTPTTDVKPDITANYAQGGGITNRGTGGGAASGAAGIIEKLASTLTDEGLAALKSAIANKTNGTITLQKKDGTTTTATCKDGTCTLEDGTTVTAADCAACSDCTPK